MQNFAVPLMSVYSWQVNIQLISATKDNVGHFNEYAEFISVKAAFWSWKQFSVTPEASGGFGELTICDIVVPR